MSTETPAPTTKRQLPAFVPGDQVRVWIKILGRDRVRLTPFEGTVIRRRGARGMETFSVRRVTHGEGVERTFSVNAPVIERLEVLQRSRVSRARLYYLRTKIGKTRLGVNRADQPADAPSAPSSSAS